MTSIYDQIQNLIRQYEGSVLRHNNKIGHPDDTAAEVRRIREPLFTLLSAYQSLVGQALMPPPPLVVVEVWQEILISTPSGAMGIAIYDEVGNSNQRARFGSVIGALKAYARNGVPEPPERLDQWLMTVDLTGVPDHIQEGLRQGEYNIETAKNIVSAYASLRPQGTSPKPEEPAPKQASTPAASSILDRDNLISDARHYASESGHGVEHIMRWRRALAALGLPNGQTPMTASEAREFANRGWKRWEPFADAIQEIEERG